MRTGKEQREIIRQMDRERYPHQCNGFTKGFMEVFYGIITGILFLLPGCMILQEQGTLLWIILIWPVLFMPIAYLSPYMHVTEHGKQVSYLKKIQYLPLDPRQLKLVRIGYLTEYLKKMLLIEYAEQILTSLLVADGHPFQSIFYSLIYTTIIGGILPFAWGSLNVWLEKQ
jgi:hypothetical protein